MKTLALGAAALAVLASGCANNPELTSCLQPNRRVAVEMSGIKIKPPPKDKPTAKPGRQSVVLKALVQGDSAWDYGSAVLKDGGKAEIDKVLKTAKTGSRRDKRPTKVGSVVVSGHIDRLEADAGMNELDEARAKAVRDYLVTKGIDSKLIFWEGKDAKEPVAVTKFCEG